MAYAGAEFAEKVIRALKGEKGIVAPTFVHLSSDKAGGESVQKELGDQLEFFSVKVELGVSLWSTIKLSFLTFYDWAKIGERCREDPPYW